MARKLRLEYPGACYHVINRGNYRRDLFAGKGAAEGFEQCLFETAQRCGWKLHAYVIMRNHFHLAVETPEPNLSAGMKWLQGTWAMRFNRYRAETGRPFQGRYKALHVEPGHALAQVCHYIHLNPVRAKVVPVGRLAEFARSSLAWFPRKNRPAWLQPDTVLAECGGLPDTANGWRKYHDYLGLLAEEELRLRDARYGRLSRGWLIGSKEFRRAVLQDLTQQGADLEKVELLGTHAMQELREARWAEVLQLAANQLRINLRELPLKRSSPEKVLLAALLKRTTTVSNGWLTAQLDMGSPACVSQYVRRFRLEGGETEPRFKTTLSILKT